MKPHKIVVFHEMTRCFIAAVDTYPVTKELFSETADKAYGFKSVKEAEKWADGSGFSTLKVMVVLA